VFKGVGAPGSISVQALLHPIPTADLDGNGTIDVPSASTPTMDSYLAFVNWQVNGQSQPPPPSIWTTAGAGYGTLFGDNTAVLDDGLVIRPPNPN